MNTTALWQAATAQLAEWGFNESPGHLVIETLFALVIIYLLMQKSYKPSKKLEDLTEKEIDQLCEEWVPEPLIPPSNSKGPEIRPPIVQSGPGSHVIVNGKSAVNFAALNFLGISSEDSVKTSAANALEKYGVGSCGPRGFYGTIDVHLMFEDRVAKFMGVQEAILYSFDILTVASAIPAFAKRGDIIVCDNGVNYAIQSGVALSRSDVAYFKHNDVADLEKTILEQEQRHKGKKCRRWIVVEGLYMNYADICPLPAILNLRQKYKYRVLMDETFSFGVLGKAGRGCTEHWGLKCDAVDIITASMANSLASVGGFCIGRNEVVDHQRLAGAGYCFSASLPPFLAAAAVEALNIIETHPEKLDDLRQRATYLYKALSSHLQLSVMGDCGSPVLHVRLSGRSGTRDDDRTTLQQIVDEALSNGVLLTMPHYSSLERLSPPEPSIRMTVSATHTEQEIDHGVKVLLDAVKSLSS
mmetsp:Transcript_21080/g.35187  ORF Transcript_21080/g.35187 Transcript_21080/m.35187 type:complete len:471 (-) Transcript_21080:17-1429(-)